jgi:hypothetical protein
MAEMRDDRWIAQQPPIEPPPEIPPRPPLEEPGEPIPEGPPEEPPGWPQDEPPEVPPEPPREISTRSHPAGSSSLQRPGSLGAGRTRSCHGLQEAELHPRLRQPAIEVQQLTRRIDDPLEARKKRHHGADRGLAVDDEPTPEQQDRERTELAEQIIASIPSWIRWSRRTGSRRSTRRSASWRNSRVRP